VLVMAYPVAYGIRNTFWEVNLLTPDEPFIGFENYVEVFTDPQFFNALTRSLIFVAGTVLLGMIIAMSFALVLHNIGFGRRIFRGTALLPYFVSGVAAAVMWRFFFSADAGIVNALLDRAGGPTPVWLGEEVPALVVVTLANIWYVSPFATLILLAGLQMMDGTLLEAAKIDGATPTQMFRHIIFPTLAPQVALALVWLSFSSFNIFDLILPMTGGGPGRATEVLALYMYGLAFNQLNFGTASVVMALLLTINAGLSLLYLKLFPRDM
jgi:ABC-type sugar transport system permease subunit